ncbi:MAG: hypothetical protein ABJB76_10295 [Candidatus Nitrosocosmicus sp.]
MVKELLSKIISRNKKVKPTIEEIEKSAEKFDYSPKIRKMIKDTDDLGSTTSFIS